MTTALGSPRIRLGYSVLEDRMEVNNCFASAAIKGPFGSSALTGFFSVLFWVGGLTMITPALAIDGFTTSPSDDPSYMLDPVERARFPKESVVTWVPWLGFGSQTYRVGSEIDSGSSRSFFAAGGNLYWSFWEVHQVGLGLGFNSFENDDSGLTTSGFTGIDAEYTLSLLRLGDDFAIAIRGIAQSPTGSGDFSGSAWQFVGGPQVQIAAGNRVVLHSHVYASFSTADEDGYTHGSKIAVVGGLRLALDGRICSEGADWILGVAGGYRFSVTEDADEQGAIPLSGRRSLRFWSDISYRLAHDLRLYGGFAVVALARNQWEHAALQFGGRVWF